MDKLSIGRMAETNHVSVQTLRLYDRMNLLKPQYVDTNRYRYYNIKQSARLDMIQNLQMLGMSLKQIKELLEKQDFLAVQDFLKLKQRDLDFHIRELTMRKKAIERTLTNCQRYTASPRDGMIVTEFIPKRKIYYYDSGINFYDYGIETYEYILRELKQHILLHELSMAYFCNVGTILRKKRFVAREFVSTEIFIFVDEDFSSSSGLDVLPAQTYLCICCDSFYKEKEYALKLLEHVEEKKYTITGDYICEVVMDLPVFADNERGMFIKLQVPINF
jgi:DNA-binding transcriptional MerR regulator